jgi:hypothetical protein
VATALTDRRSPNATMQKNSSLVANDGCPYKTLQEEQLPGQST